MQQADIYRELTEIIGDILPLEGVTLTPMLQSKDVAGWDSFKHIEILVAVEQHYGISFRTKEIDRLTNVGDLVALIEAKT